MKVVVLYRPESEFARGVEQYVREFTNRTGKTIELVNVDSRSGTQMMNLYGVMDHPTFLAIAADGVLLDSWSGNPLPLINDLSAYAQAGQTKD